MPDAASLIASPRGLLMLGYLPRLYQQSVVVAGVLQGEGAEFDAVRDAAQQVLLGAYVATAPDWALGLWEAELGITTTAATVFSDDESIGLGLSAADPTGAANLTSDQRRARIYAHLRANGTATLPRVTQLAITFEGSQIQVWEDVAHYAVYVRFVGFQGAPANLADLQAAMRALIPAHLSITYVENFLTWDRLAAKNWTWAHIATLGLTWAQMPLQPP